MDHGNMDHGGMDHGGMDHGGHGGGGMTDMCNMNVSIYHHAFPPLSRFFLADLSSAADALHVGLDEPVHHLQELARPRHGVARLLPPGHRRRLRRLRGPARGHQALRDLGQQAAGDCSS